MQRDNCDLCKTDGKLLGVCPVYLKYDKADPTGVSYGLKKNYNVFICSKCAFFWIQNPDDTYEQMYVDEYWTAHMAMRGWPEISTEERVLNDEKYAKLRLPDILQYIKSGNVLEIASSTGSMLKILKENGFGPDVHGVEVNKVAIEQSTKYANCYIHPRTLTGNEKEIPNNHYDLLIAFDVIEHLNDFMEQCKIWVDKVQKGGMIIIECPDSGCKNCLENPLASSKGLPSQMLWDDYLHPYDHMNYFNQEHVKQIFTDLGCMLIWTGNIWTTDRMRVIFKKIF